MVKKKFIILLILFLNIFGNCYSDNEPYSKLENNIAKNLRCLICQGQSIYDSQSDFAESMKIVVRKKLDIGMTEKEIYSFLSEKYGDWLLYDPRFNQNTLLLWLIPLFLFLLGGLLIFKKLVVLKK